MNQVEYNLRYASYRAEQKAIEKKYAAMKDQVEAGSSAEEELEAAEENEMASAKSRFGVDTAGTITAY